jgi:predicted ATPase
MVHLSIEALRNDSHPEPGIGLARDGRNLAAFVAGWRMEFPERMQQFDDIIRRCLPEMSQVLAQPTDGGLFRLLFKQSDGERFDAKQVSDGVLVFAGLVAHVLSAPQGALVLIEEPERGIHPRRLADFVELLRTLVHERQVQFIMATHSPALLNLFRDEPEAILMLRRETEGSTIHRLSDAHALTETLKRADPGEMLANGVFNEALSA